MNDMPEKKPIRISKHLIVPIILTALNVVMLAGLARWSWYVADEQARLRRDFAELQNSQKQLNTQFEFWLKKIRDSR